ncbi:MAG: hypothetical protein ACP5XB_29565, partial [Isosphaeraceae bacterium]
AAPAYDDEHQAPSVRDVIHGMGCGRRCGDLGWARSRASFPGGSGACVWVFHGRGDASLRRGEGELGAQPPHVNFGGTTWSASRALVRRMNAAITSTEVWKPRNSCFPSV